MADGAIVFAMANPTPEIDARGDRATSSPSIATGRSDYPNQINNVLAFPGIFRGALDVRAPTITEEMKLAAADAIAAVVEPDELAAGLRDPECVQPRCRSGGRRGVAARPRRRASPAAHAARR